jgi:hypothetical protein
LGLVELIVFSDTFFIFREPDCRVGWAASKFQLGTYHINKRKPRQPLEYFILEKRIFLQNPSD